MTENKPYVKQFDKTTGELLNPIRGLYPNVGPNRKERRYRESRFMNNRGGAHIQVVKTTKFRKVLQRYYKASGEVGVVKHWLEN